MKNHELAELLVRRSYLRARDGEPFVLASGDTSDFYFDCQKTTLCTQALPLIGEAFLAKFKELRLRPEAVGGLVLGADPIAMAIAHTSVSSANAINVFRIRKETKDHGTRNFIEGCAERGTSVVVVDDVVTRGSSVIQAIEICRKEGLNILGCVVLVDRQQNGGMDKIADAIGGGRPIEAIFTWASLQPLIAQYDADRQKSR